MVDRYLLFAKDTAAIAGKTALAAPFADYFPSLDGKWKDHLLDMDHLKEGIGLRGYGQRDPLVEYKKESFSLFQDMKGRIEEDVVRYAFHLRAVPATDAPPIAAPPPRRATPLTLNNPAAETIPAFAGASKSAGAAAVALTTTPASAQVGAGILDANTATEAQLTGLPGMTPAIAKAAAVSRAARPGSVTARCSAAASDATSA